MKKIKIYFLFIISIIMCSCSIKVGMLYPSPNIQANINETIFFEISDDIKDSFEVISESMKSLKVNRWRSSLKNGFITGFKKNFSIAQSKNNADYVIKLEEVYPLHQIIDYWVFTCITKIRYKAALLDDEGKLIKISSKTIYSKDTPYSIWDFSVSLENTIADMYEAIADDFFN